jgi:replicative DNA helicase
MSDFDQRHKQRDATETIAVLHASIDAEQAVLGALIYDSRLWHDLQPLSPETFYDPVHRRIYTAISDMIRAGVLVDGVTLKERLRGDGALTDIGGAGYVLRLLESAARLPAQAVQYASMLRDLAQRRALASALSQSAQQLGDAISASAALTSLEAVLADIAAGDDTADAWNPLDGVMEAAVIGAEDGQAQGLSTGLASLDACTGGLRPGTVWVIGGASSMGKSVIGQNIAIALAQAGHGVAWVHLEMGEADIGLRAAAQLAYRRGEAVYSGQPGANGNPHYLSAMRRTLSPSQWERMRNSASAMRAAPIFVDARPGRTLSQIEAAARRLKRRLAKKGQALAAIVIDHQGLIAPEKNFPSELERTKDRANRTLAMAKALGVTVIALAQLTKDGSRQDGDVRLPTKDDLDFGSEWDRAAEVIMLVHRKAYYAERKAKHLQTDADMDAIHSKDAMLIVDKSRAGKRGQVPIIMDVAAAWIGDANTAGRDM